MRIYPSHSIYMTTGGRITIPKEIRQILDLKPGTNFSIEFDRRKRVIKLERQLDILEFAKKIKVKKKINPVKAREYMETHYERV